VRNKKGGLDMPVWTKRKFYTEANLSGGVTTAFKQLTLAFEPSYWVLYNNNEANWIEYSDNETEIIGRIPAGAVEDEPLHLERLWIKGQSGGESFQLSIYGGKEF